MQLSQVHDYVYNGREHAYEIVPELVARSESSQLPKVTIRKRNGVLVVDSHLECGKIYKHDREYLEMPKFRRSGLPRCGRPVYRLAPGSTASLSPLSAAFLGPVPAPQPSVPSRQSFAAPLAPHPSLSRFRSVTLPAPDVSQDQTPHSLVSVMFLFTKYLREPRLTALP